MGMFPPIEKGNAFAVELCAANVGADKGYMIVDLSDTTNWPHVNTGKVVIYNVAASFTLDSSFTGRFDLGWLSGVTATNGDLHHIHSWRFDAATAGVNFSDELTFGGSEAYFECNTAYWFGLTSSDDTTWQSDVNLTGPDGNASFPSGNGDLVCRVDRGAGTMSFGLTVIYTTIS